MLTPDLPEVVVPPIVQPRKNKRVINGKFNVLDFIIYGPVFVLIILLFALCPMPYWALPLLIFGLGGFSVLLCWPLSFLGKDKPYLFIAKGIKYLFGSNKFLTSEEEFNKIGDSSNKTPVKSEKDSSKKEMLNKPEQKNQSVKKPIQQKPDLLTRILERKNNKKKKESK